MRDFLLYVKSLFSFNPIEVLHYNSPSILWLFALCGAFFVAALLIKMWRKKMTGNLRKLTHSWSMVSFWSGIVGLLLIVSRVERIQLLSMPFLWYVLGLCLVVFALIQWRLFRTRYYEVLPRAVVEERDPYLPGKKKR